VVEPVGVPVHAANGEKPDLTGLLNTTCNVRTWWNLMYDMLAFALQHHTAIDEITGNKTANLRQYELNDTEWRIGEQLIDTLKVH
jgi:hypothetical protein